MNFRVQIPVDEIFIHRPKLPAKDNPKDIGADDPRQKNKKEPYSAFLHAARPNFFLLTYACPSDFIPAMHCVITHSFTLFA